MNSKDTEQSQDCSPDLASFKAAALDADLITQTVERLCLRIYERFPDSSLFEASKNILAISRRAKKTLLFIGSPIVWLRALTIAFLSITALICISVVISGIRLPDNLSFVDLVTVLEAGINDVVLIGAGVFFLLTFESRIRRSRALRALHELRAVAHVVDMLQLTKDPERTRERGPNTKSSPVNDLTLFELSRYLDYSSELLSLTGKIAALYGQEFDDASALAAVNEIESLTTGLSRKIWQKLMIVHQLQSH